MTLEETEPKKPATSAAALGRSGTLSWKQRPQSGSLRRPLSMASRSPERATATSPLPSPEPSSPEPTSSRSSIAASLATKDPAWFRQTADRGVGSAAYRKSQEESTSDAESISLKRQLPGMSRESTVEPEVSKPSSESIPSRGRLSANASISDSNAETLEKARSPLPVLESQKFAPPSDSNPSLDDGSTTASARSLAMSPTQGRISPERERSASPTKGMGGFVQSAMLKRSDSVSKRWSTQTPPGLTRQNSTLSNRGSVLSGYSTMPRSERPAALSRDNSVEPSSRPTSSHSNAAFNKNEKTNPSRDEFVKPALPHHSRSKSVASTFSEKDQPQDDVAPSSPSKRWSPTKSSWLESALSRPDSPKPKQPPPAQPAWMTEISRIKQQRGSVDFGKENPPQNTQGDSAVSGRISPIKDVQLKPIGFRKPELPKKEQPIKMEEKSKLMEPLERSKSTPLPKPEPTVRDDIQSSNEATESKEDNKVSSTVAKPSAEATTEAPSLRPTLKSATSESSLRFGKDTTRPTILPKPKPDTPPKKDFRAGLKPRQQIGDSSKKEEVNELQNVFGKLRKAETKNYVAPNLLKDNITRGKNALNVTGGPKPTVRRDEFKESILSKKTAMLEKAKEEGSAFKKAESSEKEKNTTPEAITRKKSLASIRPKVDDKPVQPGPLFATKEPTVSSKLAGRFNPALAGMLARGPPSLAANKSTTGSESDTTPARSSQEEKTGPGPELQHMTKGRARGPKRRAPVAKKVEANPEAPLEKVTTVASPLSPSNNGHVPPKSEWSETNGPLDAAPVTKTPARQSKAEKPATPAKSPRVASGNFGKMSTPELPKKPTMLELDRGVSASSATPRKVPQAEAVASPKTQSPGIPKKPASLDNDRRASGSHGTPPASPFSRALDSAKPSSPSPSPSAVKSPLSQASPILRSKPALISPKPKELPNPPTPDLVISKTRNEPSPEKAIFPSVRNASSSWGKSAGTPLESPKMKVPIKLPTRADEQAAMVEAGLVRSPVSEDKPLPEAPLPKPVSPIESKPLPPKPKPTGLGFSLGSLGGLVATRSRESSPLPSTNFPISPPNSANRPQSETYKGSSPSAKKDGMFSDIFDEAPVTPSQLPEHIDTVQILKSPPLDLGPSGKIRTLRKHIQEVNGDGRLFPIPMQEEHVLFQDSMYLCTHIYGDLKGARHTDVYLWAGNGVAEPVLEDVQLFAKNHAKQNQGKLIIIRQGQEPPNFFDALGGIVITRRGTKPASKEFMLCGRRHLGHLAFDEVDFSPKSLCSAFPFVISTASSKVLLWKGRGCSAEELSGARLMGMDLAPTGDFNEIDEGSEPASFLEAFPPFEIPKEEPAIPRSADHWHYKPNTEKYSVRLFKVQQSSDQAGGWSQAALQVSSSFFAQLRRPSWNGSNAEQTPQTPKTPGGIKTEIREIMPFSQRDLEPEHIYVLDAFFDMYM